MAEKKHGCGCEQENCNCEHEHNHEHEHCDCGCEHEHGCDCGCEHDDDTVILLDENGNEVPFHYVYNMEHEGKEYVFLQADDGEEVIEIFAVNTVEENGEYYDMLDPVDDELYDVLYEKLLLVAAEDACEDDE